MMQYIKREKKKKNGSCVNILRKDSLVNYIVSFFYIKRKKKWIMCQWMI
jgi:hypothetical protein